MASKAKTDNTKPRQKRSRDDRFTFKAVYSDVPMSEADKEVLWGILIEALVNRYEAEFPEKFK